MQARDAPDVAPLLQALCFTREGEVIRFKHIRQSLLNEDIPSWRKLAVLLVEISGIVLGTVHFGLFFDPGEGGQQLYASVGSMVVVAAFVQVIGSWFAFKQRVPVYLWVSCGIWVFTTLFWQGLVVVLLTAT